MTNITLTRSDLLDSKKDCPTDKISVYDFKIHTKDIFKAGTITFVDNGTARILKNRIRK